jgi:hypothetical protein
VRKFVPSRVTVELAVARRLIGLGVSGGNDLVERDFGALVDLETVRATLDYIHGDLARVRRLAPVAAALAKAIDELDAIGGSRTDLQFDRLVSLPEGRQIR